MYGELKRRIEAELDEIREAGLWKGERVLEGPQGAAVRVLRVDLRLGPRVEVRVAHLHE